MRDRDWFLLIKDILKCCNKITKYTKGLKIKEFIEDDKTYDAVLRNLEIIGEAVKKIPEDIKSDYGKIEWRKIAVSA